MESKAHTKLKSVALPSLIVSAAVAVAIYFFMNQAINDMERRFDTALSAGIALFTAGMVVGYFSPHSNFFARRYARRLVAFLVFIITLGVSWWLLSLIQIPKGIL